MCVYKVVLANDGITSCRKTVDNASIYNAYQYEHEHGRLLYALIKEHPEAHAHSMAIDLIAKTRYGAIGTEQSQ